MKAAPDRGRPVGSVDDSARQRLGQNLRLFYASVLDQPLPERFTQLLDALSAAPPPTREETGDREGSR